MQVRRLNDRGLREFQAILGEARLGNPISEARTDVLESEQTSPQGLNVAVLVDSSIHFRDKRQLARYLDQKLRPSESDALSRDRGLWAWLSLYFLDTLCPLGQDGTRAVYSDWYYYIPSTDYRTYFRHLLYTPYVIYNSFQGSVGKCLLTGEPSIWGDVSEQIAARQEFITSRPVLEVIDSLYFDDSDGIGRVKTGARTPNRSGGLRRLITFLQQIDATYDLYGMACGKILELLPAEFDEWR